MAGVTMESVTKVYGEDVVAVSDMNLYIEDGEFVVFVGPSGCGKTTALRMIAGLEDITEGKIFIGDSVINDVLPRDRDIAMVFQNYALLPHMSIRDNMGLSLKVRNEDKGQIRQRVEDAAKILGIEGFLNRKPIALSGGQRQRVALGRAIVREPKVFLMDEPLSNLDAKLRVQMRTEISRLHNRIGTTTVYVTHDQTEAMTMADKVVVLKDGFVQQIDHPQRMYDHPSNVFVAGFIGSPAMNFINAHLEGEQEGYVVVFGETRVPLSREISKENENSLDKYVGEEVVLGIRPEHIEDARLTGDDIKGKNTVEIEPQVIESMGSEKYLYFGLGEGQAAQLQSIEDLTDFSSEDEEKGGSSTASGELMVAVVAPESTAKEGEKLHLALDASKAKLFDPETEETIV